MVYSIGMNCHEAYKAMEILQGIISRIDPAPYPRITFDPDTSNQIMRELDIVIGIFEDDLWPEKRIK
jgi:hypothetical protein